MKKRVFSLVCFAAMVCVMSMGIANTARAEDKVLCVDGSYLTTEESSTGSTSDGLARGEHLMDGNSAITFKGVGRIYAYGATTARHTVDYVGVIVYVDRYSWETGRWHQIYTWTAERRNAYYVETGRTLTVDSGEYYRVRCDHFAGNDADFPYDEAISVTDGILVK